MRGEFVDVDGVRLYYYAAGTRGAGDPLLLLHGFATSGHLWQYVVPLIPAGYRTIVADIAGHGRSEASANAPTVAEHARLISGLLHALRVERSRIAAHGMGCEIALALAHARPGCVTSLLLASAAGPGEAPASVPSRLSPVHAAALAGSVRVTNYLLTRRLVRGYVDRERGARHLARHLDRYQSREEVRSIASQIRAAAGDARAHMPSGVPAMIVHGADDPFSDARKVRARFAGTGAIHELDGERHFLPEEAPEALAGLLAELLRA